MTPAEFKTLQDWTAALLVEVNKAGRDMAMVGFVHRPRLARLAAMLARLPRVTVGDDEGATE